MISSSTTFGGPPSPLEKAIESSPHPSTSLPWRLRRVTSPAGDGYLTVRFANIALTCWGGNNALILLVN